MFGIAGFISIGILFVCLMGAVFTPQGTSPTVEETMKNDEKMLRRI